MTPTNFAELHNEIHRIRAERDAAHESLVTLGRAVERHLATFGYDNCEGLADALAKIGWTDNRG